MLTGTVYEFPLEVTWSGGDVEWIDLFVIDYGHCNILLLVTNYDRSYMNSVPLRMDSFEFSKVFFNMVDAAISDAADYDEEHWKTQTWTAKVRE